jgi:putative ABC transport system substrate-binding protein
VLARRTVLAAAASFAALPARPAKAVYRIGYLSLGAPGRSGRAWDPGPLRELGWIEGKNIQVEARYAGDRSDLLARFAAELVRLNVDLIATSGTDAALAAKAATTNIPIVLYAAGDPVGSGLVASLARPGGNVTGYSVLSTELRGKRLELLRELVPDALRVGELVNPRNPLWRVSREAYEATYRAFGLQPLFIDVSAAADVSSAFATLVERRVQAMLVPEDNLFDALAAHIMGTALERSLPAIVGDMHMVRNGGLATYAVAPGEGDERFAYFVDRILRGAKPADLPIAQATRFETGLNLRTAKALAVRVPHPLLLRAQTVIR